MLKKFCLGSKKRCVFAQSSGDPTVGLLSFCLTRALHIVLDSGYPPKRYRLNYAQYGISERRFVCLLSVKSGINFTHLLCRPPDAPLFSVFAGDLAPEVTDTILEVRRRANVRN